MKTHGFTIAYKDKDGFDCPLYEHGILTIHPNEFRAKLELEKKKTEIRDILNPRKQYRATGFFNKKVTEIPPPKLMDHVRNELTQQYNTLFVKAVTVY